MTLFFRKHLRFLGINGKIKDGVHERNFYESFSFCFYFKFGLSEFRA
jgi:hypothetical protein